jgi:hypothetical protein
MQLATSPSFTERLNFAYDLNRGHAPASGAERATRADIIEYIDAFSVEQSPSHPTSVIEWDLIRTLGESEGRRMLLYASRRWDAKPIRARDIVHKWWEDDYEPRAWVDEYLVDLIRDWRSERNRLRHCDEAKQEWLAFDGFATWQQIATWQKKFLAWYPEPQRKHGPVAIVPTLSQAQFARDMRAGRVPGPSAPEDPAPKFKISLGPTLLGRKRK